MHVSGRPNSNRLSEKSSKTASTARTSGGNVTPYALWTEVANLAEDDHAEQAVPIGQHQEDLEELEQDESGDWWRRVATDGSGLNPRDPRLRRCG